MRKLWMAVALALLVSFALAEGQYAIDDRPMAEMSIEELYSVEDAVVEALREAFERTAEASDDGEIVGTYVVNPKTMKFHYPFCYSALQIGAQRRFERCAPSELRAQGYLPCGQCKPAPADG